MSGKTTPRRTLESVREHVEEYAEEAKRRPVLADWTGLARAVTDLRAMLDIAEERGQTIRRYEDEREAAKRPKPKAAGWDLYVTTGGAGTKTLADEMAHTLRECMRGGHLGSTTSWIAGAPFSLAEAGASYVAAQCELDPELERILSEEEEIERRTQAGVYYATANGNHGPAGLQAVIDAATMYGAYLEDGTFVRPENIRRTLGLSYTMDCGNGHPRYFQSVDVPPELCQCHAEVEVLTDSGIFTAKCGGRYGDA